MLTFERMEHRKALADCMPRAARLIPYMLAKVKETKIVIARLKTGMIVEL